MTTIRPSNAKDFPDIVRIYNQAVIAGGITGDEHTLILEERRPWLEQHTGERYSIFVAESAVKVVGYLALSPYRYGRSAFFNTVEISYYIDKQYRGQGIAGSLIEHALKSCEKLQIQTLVAILLSGNAASISLLEKYQFNEWGRMPGIAKLKNGAVDHLYYGRHV